LFGWNAGGDTKNKNQFHIRKRGHNHTSKRKKRGKGCVEKSGGMKCGRGERAGGARRRNGPRGGSRVGVVCWGKLEKHRDHLT